MNNSKDMLNKKIASIPSFLLSKEESTKLGLQDQSYVLIIPKKLLDDLKITRSEITFDLFLKNKKLLLVEK
ncbi:MAG: hypothetical protein V3U87_15825 [Methylococcaceae bacterium]